MIIKQPAFGDGSHWKIVDWDNLDARLLGMIWKITQGKYYVDPTCKTFWAEAGRKKLPRSVFHFFEPNDISVQVVNFLTACEDIGIIISGRWMGEIEPVLDAEYVPPTTVSRMLKAIGIETSKLSKEKLTDLRYPDQYLAVSPNIKWTAEKTTLTAAVTGMQLAAQYKMWLDGVESELGIKSIIYTSKWMWSFTGFPAWASEYPLWDAQYPTKPDGQDHPLYVPYGGWTKEWGWQYSSSATLQGVSGFMDVSRANCTVEEWKEKYGGGEVPPEPPKPGETDMTITIGTVLALDLNVRNAPNGTIIGAAFLHKGDLVQFDRLDGVWGHLKAARRAGQNLTLPGAECWASMGATGGLIRGEWRIEAAPATDAAVSLVLGGASVDGKSYVPESLTGSTVVYKKA